MANPDYDSYVLEKSLVSNETPFIFKNKKFVTITDSNNLSYNGGQVQFDLTQIASSSDFLDLKNSYLALPLELKASAGAGHFADPNAVKKGFGLKNGFHHLINSMSVYLSGQEVVSTQQFSNIPIQYKLMTEMSVSDLFTLAPSIGFWKDVPEIKYDDVYGEYLANDSALELRNSSLTNINDDEVLNFTNEARVIAARKPFVKAVTRAVNIGGEGAPHVVQQTYEIVKNYMAIIPLAHLHDFFYQCPLVKGSYFRIVLNLNAPCSCVWAGANPHAAIPSTTTTTNMIPFQLNTSEANSPMVVSGGGNLSITLKIGNALQTSCELRAQMCEFNPSFAQQYLNSGAKTIKYTDFQTYDNMKDIASGENKQHQLTAGLGRLRKLLLLPFIGSSGNKGVPATASPYTSCPATCMPYVNLSNFNVQLSGANLYQTNLTYSWQQWLESCASLGGINGNPLAEVGIKSGLISETDWYNGYGFIHVNLSNKDEPQDELPRSVMVQFQNNSQKPISVHATIYYEREITIDPATGQLII